MAATKKTTKTPIEKSLGYYGEQFEYKFIRSLIDNPMDFIEVAGLLHPSDVSDAGLQAVVKVMIDIFNKKGRPGTWKEIEYSIKESIAWEEALEMAKIAYSKVKDADTDAIDDVTEIGIRFLKQQEMKKVMLGAVSKMEKDGYSIDILGDTISNLRAIEMKTRAATETPQSLLERVLSEGEERRIPTGLRELDKNSDGGLARGTIGMIVAGTGVGKTTMMVHLACKAAAYGYKTLYIYFEDSNTDMARKTYAFATGMYTKEFRNGNKDKAYQALKDAVNKYPKLANVIDNPNYLHFLRLTNGETTVEEIKANILMLENRNGWTPDIVFLDYIGCIQSSTDKRLAISNEYQTLDRALKKLDAFCKEKNFALWVGQQSNRMDTDPAKRNEAGGNIQGSYRMLQTAATNIFVYKNKSNPSDINRVDIIMDKCRGGMPTAWRNAYMNRGTCRIDLSCAEALDSNLVIDDVMFDKKLKSDDNEQGATYQFQQGTAGNTTEISK